MSELQTLQLPDTADVIAPDGSEVRLLSRLAGGSMAHFHLPAGQVSRAIRHRRVDEIWYITEGRGQMWRRLEQQEQLVDLLPGVSLTIPAGSCFQFRASVEQSLSAVAVTMPPWPGDDEAVFVDGIWPSVND